MNEERKKRLYEDRDLLAGLSEIPAVLTDPENRPLPFSAVSLKDCFARDHLDSQHIDSLILKKIARSMARLMKEFRDRGIFPGLYDMKDIYVDLAGSDYPVYLLFPERFQMGEMEQDYEWYPEDERNLPDTVFFDQAAQDRANQRFLFRILVGSSRGNIHFPPVRSEMDYAQIFYNILPDEWKTWLEEDRIVPAGDWIEALDASIEAEERMARQVRGKAVAELYSDLEAGPGKGEEEKGDLLHILFLLLRTDPDCADSMSRLLYDMQEILEGEACIKKYQLNTAIVYGDGVVKARDFRQYPEKFRFQIPSRISEYSPGEAMVIGAAMMEEYKKKHSEGIFRIGILLDGKIANDGMFRAGLEYLARLGDQGVSFAVRCLGDVDCEACQSLKELEHDGRGR